MSRNWGQEGRRLGNVTARNFGGILPPKGHAIALVVVGVVSTRGKVRTKTRCGHYLLCEKELGHLSVPGRTAPTAKMAEKIIRQPRIVVVEEGEDRYTCTV